MVPYYPELKKSIRSVTACLVLTYLEVHHPAPQDSEEVRPVAASLPVEVHTNELTAALGIHRRTLIVALSAISAWFSSNFERLLARRSGREFLVRRHTQHSPYKLYAIVGPRNQFKDSLLLIYRNRPLLTATLAQCGFSTFPPDEKLAPIPASSTDFEKTCESASSLPTLRSVFESVLLHPSLSVDRRRSRYARLRNAVENGLLPSSASSVTRKGKSRSHQDLDGAMEHPAEDADPMLPASLLERLTSRRVGRLWPVPA